MKEKDMFKILDVLAKIGKTNPFKSSYSSMFFEKCGCGYKKPKASVWASLLVLGLFLYFL